MVVEDGTVGPWTCSPANVEITRTSSDGPSTGRNPNHVAALMINRTNTSAQPAFEPGARAPERSIARRRSCLHTPKRIGRIPHHGPSRHGSLCPWCAIGENDRPSSGAVPPPSTPPDSRSLPTPDEEIWIEAIHEDRLHTIDHPTPRAACAAIGARMAAEVADIESWLADAGLSVVSGDPRGSAPRQRHTAELIVDDARTAAAAAAVLATHGFEVWEPTSGAAGAIHARFRSVLTVARTSDVTVAVRFRWTAPSSRLPRSLLPNQADASFVDLPAPLWPLAFVMRPIRLAAERFGLRQPAPPVLGPFLSTPQDLIAPLLAFAEVGSEDTIADLGCGDGRILVEAAERTGCRALGIESDTGLVERARERARRAGVGDRVRIVEGDAQSAELGQATTVFVFLPVDTAADLVSSLLETLEPGTRVIAHEQHRLPREIPGGITKPLIADGGVTVAQQWVVGR